MLAAMQSERLSLEVVVAIVTHGIRIVCFECKYMLYPWPLNVLNYYNLCYAYYWYYHANMHTNSKVEILEAGHHHMQSGITRLFECMVL